MNESFIKISRMHVCKIPGRPGPGAIEGLGSVHSEIGYMLHLFDTSYVYFTYGWVTKCVLTLKQIESVINHLI